MPAGKQIKFLDGLNKRKGDWPRKVTLPLLTRRLMIGWADKTFLAKDLTEANDAVSSLKHSTVPWVTPDALKAAIAFSPATVLRHPETQLE